MFEEKFVGILNKRILERKPNLKLCSNHYKSGPRIYRAWNHGTAKADGRGWYMASHIQKRVKVDTKVLGSGSRSSNSSSLE
jgi:hypothetical protein